MTLHYAFDPSIDAAAQARIREALPKAFASGEILPCPCSTVEAWVYETRPPDFQASISCSCGLMRPLYSSTPDSD